MSLILTAFILGTTPAFDIEQSTQQTVDYLQETVAPVIQKGAEWGATAGIAVSSINAFVVIVKKLMNVD